jgi:hypothetical protein
MMSLNELLLKTVSPETRDVIRSLLTQQAEADRLIELYSGLYAQWYEQAGKYRIEAETLSNRLAIFQKWFGEANPGMVIDENGTIVQSDNPGDPVSEGTE